LQRFIDELDLPAHSDQSQTVLNNLFAILDANGDGTVDVEDVKIVRKAGLEVGGL